MPINLPSEILLCIFTLNAIAHTEDSGITQEPLVNTRFSSQVCHKWRQIILSSSKLWGRLVIFGDNQRIEWLEEVIRRSKSAPLRIYFSASGTSERQMDALSFFFDTLSTNWERMEVVVFSASFYDDGDSSGNWAFLHRPAPLLKVFSAWTHQTSSLFVCCPRPVPFKEPLFSSTSPLLHSFRTNIDLIDNHEYDFKNLQTLCIYHHSDLSQLLQNLKMMPSLESLFLEVFPDYSDGDLQDLQSPIALPRLSTLNTDTPISTFLALLDRITTGPGCCIQATMRVFDHEDLMIEEIVKRLPEIFGKCIKHPEVSEIKGLSLSLLDKDLLTFGSCNRGWGPDFCLRFVWCLSMEKFERIIPRLMHSFQSRHFGDGVQELSLIPYLMNPVSNRIKTTFKPFLHSNAFVKRLHVRKISVLEEYVEPELFPRLDTICIDVDNFDFPTDMDDSTAYRLLDFMKRRTKIGRSISAVHIEGPFPIRGDKLVRLSLILHDLGRVNILCENTLTGQKIEYFCGPAGK